MQKIINKNKISVCVPSYNRPEMIRQLIMSFLNQDYKNKELVISDDSSNSEVEAVCQSFNDGNIKYYRNEINLGYAKNFLVSIKRATGDYIIVLGDDDLLLSKSTLSKYVEIFNNNPVVNYIYSNSIQFSNKLKVDNILKTFSKNVYFKKGEESMKNIWMTSLFIPGIGLRNNIDFSQYYPKYDMLFPQVELVGHIINLYDSYGISDFLIAGRAHGEQLGFYATKGERIKGTEKHGTVELFEIFGEFKKKYDLSYNDDFISNKFVQKYCTFILKEKMITSNAKIKLNYNNFCRVSKVAAESKKFKVVYYLALLFPKLLIRLIRYVYIIINRFRNIEGHMQAEDELRKILIIQNSTK